MEFSIFTQIKYLDMKVLLATPSDGNFSVVALLILDLRNSGTSTGEHSAFLGDHFEEMVR